jgi:hypothetical protein
MRTTDAYGNHSLPITGFSSSYGELYQNSLKPQTVVNVALTETEGLVNWNVAPNNFFRNEIRYLARSGDSVTLIAKQNNLRSELPTPQTGSKFRYRSVYLPEPTAIDTFYTDWVEYKTAFPSWIRVKSSELKAIDVSDETDSEGGGLGMHAVVDDNLNTWWHSNFTNGTSPLPHWIIVDLGKTRDLGRIEMYRWTNGSYADDKTVNFYVSDTPAYNNRVGWKEIGTILYAPDLSNDIGNKFGYVDVVPGTDAVGRYLMIFLPDSYRVPYTQVVEIYVYIK